MQIQFRIQLFKIQAALLRRPARRQHAICCKRRCTRFIVMRQLCKDLARRTRLLRRTRHDIPLPVKGCKEDADERDEEPRCECIF